MQLTRLEDHLEKQIPEQLRLVREFFESLQN